jgi:nicotinate-nucleotide adenylyltransferase
MAKIGIYGGSFNPVHFGHVGLAKWVIENTDLDELWLLVSPNNPLKPAGILAPEEERLAAVREAIKDIPHVKASDFEFSLPRPSYTANTLRELQKAYPEHTFTLIIGEDNIAIFDKWKEWEYIASNFRVFVYPRKGSSMMEDFKLKREDFLSLVYLKEAPTFDISSTAIRRSQGRQ